ncbi:AAA-ATPase ASD, mitochondrial-like isoform X2 [Rhododendron vialii]|uniref:AAA-ATPase ASD, mitochondrial-like isoform X2 n=1 Tax=Rhododendron vialii TaxID=182163 RepID=UPI00265DBA52|nr:AAA-ATPase ASD, mitochondrial-like isoform X2 [Rhododendron vialii]
MNTMGAAGVWEEATAKIAGFMFTCIMFNQLFPDFLRRYLESLKDKFVLYFFPNVEITFHEYSGSKHKISEAYSLIETYLSSKSPTHSNRIVGELVRKRESVVLTMDASEEIVDVFDGVEVKWFLKVNLPSSKTISWGPCDMEKKSYVLSFPCKDRKVVTRTYLDYVMGEGREIAVRNRQQRIYTNNPSDNWWDYKKNLWSHAVFKHPTTFKSLALDPKFKEEIIDDLATFSKGKEYYEKAGKAWKRGYLLHGPPGTGKSTMIAAIANLLSYDVYDLELSAVLSNATLKRLVNKIPCNSILVIEDIDCSSRITNHRERNTPNQGEEKKEKILETVTLSGLLNCIDGLFSANDGGRLMVFTTNHVEAIDSALLRRGRMDKHIEMPFCGFEAFKVLAKNYLGIEEHELFGKIEGLLKESSVTPADVAENLIARRGEGEDCGDDCLKKLIEVLEKSIQQVLDKKGEGKGKGKGEEIESDPSCMSS